MAKKCPPGVFCIENITLSFVFLVLAACFVFIYYFNKKNSDREGHMTLESLTNALHVNMHNNMIQRMMPSFFTSYGDSVNCNDASCSQNARNVYLDPHAPAQKINFYMNQHPANMGDVRGQPSLSYPQRGPFLQPPVMTQPLAAKCFSQIGILTDNAGTDRILPLFGRPLQTNRNKWQYYTMNDSNNIVKLPLQVRGKSSMEEYGVDEIMSNENITVQGFNRDFNATIYENQGPLYNPYL